VQSSLTIVGAILLTQIGAILLTPRCDLADAGRCEQVAEVRSK